MQRHLRALLPRPPPFPLLLPALPALLSLARLRHLRCSIHFAPTFLNTAFHTPPQSQGFVLCCGETGEENI